MLTGRFFVATALGAIALCNLGVAAKKRSQSPSYDMTTGGASNDSYRAVAGCKINKMYNV